MVVEQSGMERRNRTSNKRVMENAETACENVKLAGFLRLTTLLVVVVMGSTCHKGEVVQNFTVKTSAVNFEFVRVSFT